MATIKGRMVYIYPTQQLTSKSGNAFQKRDFVFAVQRFDPDTGEVSVDEAQHPHGSPSPATAAPYSTASRLATTSP